MRCQLTHDGWPASAFTAPDIEDARPRDIYGFDLLLLRPDLHVAWRGNRMPDAPARLAAMTAAH